MASNIKNVVTLIAVGTIAWIGAGAVAVVIGAESKIVWTCVVGAVLGVIGIRYTIRRSRRSGIQASSWEAMPRRTRPRRSASAPDGWRP